MRGHYYILATAICTLFGSGARAKDLPAGLPMAQAAKAGDAKAQHRIGYYYHTGTYVEYDLKQAAKWYKRAAEQDLLKAQYAYGRIMAFEKGGPRDYAGALPWFIKASTPKAKSQGYGEQDSLKYAKDTLDWYCKTGAAAFPQSHPYARKAECLFARGKKLYSGSTQYKVQRDYAAAFDDLTLAAQGGETDAYITLAKMHKFGYGVERNHYKAFEVLNLAGEISFKQKHYTATDKLSFKARRGDIAVHREFAGRYLRGLKYKYDPQEAMMHYFLAGRRRFLKGKNFDLLVPIFARNDLAILSRAHEAALAYGEVNKWPEKDMARITKSYQGAAKELSWLAKRGGFMPSKSESRVYFLMSLIIMLFIWGGILRLAIFIIRQWRLYADRPRRAKPFG